MEFSLCNSPLLGKMNFFIVYTIIFYTENKSCLPHLYLPTISTSVLRLGGAVLVVFKENNDKLGSNQCNEFGRPFTNYNFAISVAILLTN